MCSEFVNSQKNYFFPKRKEASADEDQEFKKKH